jgi:glucoamylase
MRLSRSLLAVGLLLGISFVGAQTSTADTYLAAESPIAKTNLLANIGSSGSKSQGAKAGIVIASPSTTNPNYLFTWTRDSALVFQAIINQ